MSSSITRREALSRLGSVAATVTTASGGSIPRAWGAAAPIKIGVITDLTGSLGYAGRANANIVKLVLDDINAQGGLLGRQLDLVLVDSASDPNIGVTKARQLIQRDRVDVVLGGITSAMRDAIKGVIVDRGNKLYIYPELYEGGECHADIFCTGPTPKQQVEPFIPWLLAHGGRRFYIAASDFVFPRVLNQAARVAIGKNGGTIVAEEYFPLDTTDFSVTVNKIMSSGTSVVFNTVIPPGITPFLGQLYDAGFSKRGGRIGCVYFDEYMLQLAPPEHLEGAAGCLDYYEAVDDPFSQALARRYREKFSEKAARFTAGSGATGIYRGITMWASAVREAETLEKGAVRQALAHAKISQGPGGPAEMVPGQHHVRMNMYIGIARSAQFEIAQKLGMIDPNECVGRLSG